MKSTEAKTTNGTASFFSLAYKPGAMNSHTCYITYGDEISRPAIAAILIQMKNASPGSV